MMPNIEASWQLPGEYACVFRLWGIQVWQRWCHICSTQPWLSRQLPRLQLCRPSPRFLPVWLCSWLTRHFHCAVIVHESTSRDTVPTVWSFTICLNVSLAKQVPVTELSSISPFADCCAIRRALQAAMLFILGNLVQHSSSFSSR